MSINRLRRQLTAANKKLKWYTAHFEAFPPTRRRRFAHHRRMMERNNIHMDLALERALARMPAPVTFRRDLLDYLSKPMSEEQRGFYMPFNVK
jgi:hypothetical protein